MSTPPQVEPFKGTDWNECCDFIVSIRNRAHFEGKLRDLEWMADLASVNFRGKALSWHARLPREVRGDWEKLEVALLDRWSPPDSDEERARIEPTPAAAPLPTTSAQSNLVRPKQGLIKAIPNDSHEPHYVTYDYPNKVFRLTANRGDALRLRFDAIPGTNTFSIINNSSTRPLTLVWKSAGLDLNRGSTSYGCMKDSGDTADSANNLIWTLSSTRELTAVSQSANESKTQLSAFTSPSRNIFLVVDPIAYGNKWKEETRASFFFEPVE